MQKVHSLCNFQTHLQSTAPLSDFRIYSRSSDSNMLIKSPFLHVPLQSHNGHDQCLDPVIEQGEDIQSVDEGW